jgi:hypothetical protein
MVGVTVIKAFHPLPAVVFPSSPLWLEGDVEGFGFYLWLQFQLYLTFHGSTVKKGRI